MSCFGFRYELLRLLHSMRRLAMSCFGFGYELLRLLHPKERQVCTDASLCACVLIAKMHC